MKARQGLIVVDYQNDFVNPETGSLYVPGAEKLSSQINDIMLETKKKGGIIIASRELHPQGHISFASNFIGKQSITVGGPNKDSMITYGEVKNWTETNNGLSSSAEFSIEELKAYLQINGDQALWPDHCVEDTQGAQYFKDLDTSLLDAEVIKGQEVDKHPYSAFGGYETKSQKSLLQLLEEAKVQTLKVVGVATDYCDIATVLDGLKKYPVQFIKKASAGVDPSTTLEAINKMREQGADII